MVKEEGFEGVGSAAKTTVQEITMAIPIPVIIQTFTFLATFPITLRLPFMLQKDPNNEMVLRNKFRIM